MDSGMAGKDDFYIILEVGRAASVADIKKSFRRLARRFHPDVNPGDRRAEEHFKRISQAYEILSHPDKRQFYDVNGFYAEDSAEGSNRATAWGFTFQGFDFSGPSFNTGSLGQVFGATFPRPSVAFSPERGADVEHRISITFEEAITGLTPRINIQRYRACPICAGQADFPSSRDSECTACAGSGKSVRRKGRLRLPESCATCHGSGRQRRSCSDCGGAGRVSRSDSLSVEIPAGVGAGSRIRFAGEGDAGLHGGPAGDLYVVTKVEPHRFFSRIGDHIQCTLPISFSEAALGAKVEVPTVDGVAMVRIPPGTQNGQVFRMREKGAPSLLQPGVRGDQLVEVRVVVPRIADERSKEILREFARLNAVDLRTHLTQVRHDGQEEG